jgi:hypothetical protein
MTRASETRLVPHGEPTRYFTFSGLAALGLPHATTTRHFPGVTSPTQPTAAALPTRGRSTAPTPCGRRPAAAGRAPATC